MEGFIVVPDLRLCGSEALGPGTHLGHAMRLWVVGAEEIMYVSVGNGS